MHSPALVICRTVDFRGLPYVPVLQHYLGKTNCNFNTLYHVLDCYNPLSHFLGLFNVLFFLVSPIDQLISLLLPVNYRPLRCLLYILLILFVRPSTILTLMPNKSINCASRFFPHIPCVEIQHGVIGSHHPYYYYNTQFEAPKSFALWTSSDFNILQSMNNHLKLKHVLIGIPNLESKAVDSGILYSKPYILYALQPSCLACPLDIAFMNTLNSFNSRDFLLVLRQHPSISNSQLHDILFLAQSRYPQLSICIEFSSVAVAQSIKNSILVVTWHSTIVRESVALGIYTFALSPDLLPFQPRSDSFPDERSSHLFMVCPAINTMSTFLGHIL